MKRRIQANRIPELVVILLMEALIMFIAPSLLLEQRLISLFVFDAVVVVLALAIPIYVILRLNWIGIIVGSIYFWLMLIAEGNILATYDKERSGLLDSVWLSTGWMVGLIYCTVIYVVMLTIRMRRNANEPSPDSGET